MTAPKSGPESTPCRERESTSPSPPPSFLPDQSWFGRQATSNIKKKKHQQSTLLQTAFTLLLTNCQNWIDNGYILGVMRVWFKKKVEWVNCGLVCTN